jgi:iron complex transport system substrate-binding protein
MKVYFYHPKGNISHPPFSGMNVHLFISTAVLSILFLVSACRPDRNTGGQIAENPADYQPGHDYFADKADVTYAKHFSVSYHGHYKIVRTHANLGDWNTPDREAKQDVMVLVQRGTPAPELRGELAGAAVITIPAGRVAVNMEGSEVWLSYLNLSERMVAVGGVLSYNDTIRQKVSTGQLGKVGYSWFSPPDFEVLLSHQPDLFLMVLSKLKFKDALQKSRNLNIPTAPVFDWAETGYLARAEWIKYAALFFNAEARANAVFAEIEGNVGRLKSLTDTIRHKPTCAWAHYVDSGFWLAYHNSLEARLLKDAGAINPFEDFSKEFNPIGEAFTSEQMLTKAATVEHWIIGETYNAPLPGGRYMESFRAWRTGNLYHNYHRSKFEHNAYDWFASAPLRPDWVLADLIALLHPHLLPDHELIYFGHYEKKRPHE